MSYPIEAIKDAAKRDMRELAETAGFRASRIPNKFHCIKHADKTPSAHLYENGVYCHGCNEWLDTVALEHLAGGGLVADAIKRLADRYGFSNNTAGPIYHRITEHEKEEAELWRIGLIWMHERALVDAKAVIPWEQGSRIVDDGAISALTRSLALLQSMTTRQAIEALLRMETEAPELVLACIAEARDSMSELAGSIVSAHLASGEVAA